MKLSVVENILEPGQTQPYRLKATVDKVLSGSVDTYAVAIKNLKTNESYYLKAHRSFQSASLYKVWVMAAVYDELRDGKIAQDHMLRQEIPVLNQKFGIASEEV